MYNINDILTLTNLLLLPETLSIIPEYLEYANPTTRDRLEDLLTENNIPLPILTKPANKV
jgi:hypothetical protein